MDRCWQPRGLGLRQRPLRLAALRHGGAAALAATCLATLGLSVPAPAAVASGRSPLIALEGMAVDTASLAGGPLVTAAGLVWQGSTDLYLTTATGTMPLVRSVALPAIDAYWMAVSLPGGVFAGRVGGPLRPVAVLTRCRPLQPSSQPVGAAVQSLLAIAGSQLYAVVSSGCLHPGRSERSVIVDLDLATLRLRILASAPSRAEALAASTGMVAIDASSTAGVQSVRVIDAVTGQELYTATPPTIDTVSGPIKMGLFADPGLLLQVDALGDVLLAGPYPYTVDRYGGDPDRVPAAAWWASPGSPAGTPVTGLAWTPALSDGRLAYAAASAQGETLSVRTLATGAIQPVAAFPETAVVQGLGFSGNVLAWARQSFGWCEGDALGPIQLQAVDLRYVPAPIVETGVLPPTPRPAYCITLG